VRKASHFIRCVRDKTLDGRIDTYFFGKLVWFGLFVDLFCCWHWTALTATKDKSTSVPTVILWLIGSHCCISWTADSLTLQRSTHILHKFCKVPLQRSWCDSVTLIFAFLIIIIVVVVVIIIYKSNFDSYSAGECWCCRLTLNDVDVIYWWNCSVYSDSVRTDFEFFQSIGPIHCIIVWNF